tara:strand:+ start:2638 stop:2766 length:129 start_codon:yes stop_codon:yes gene_type:complete
MERFACGAPKGGGVVARVHGHLVFQLITYGERNQFVGVKRVV